MPVEAFVLIQGFNSKVSDKWMIKFVIVAKY